MGIEGGCAFTAEALHSAEKFIVAERIVATPIGMAICDVALARLTYETALEAEIGTRFRLACRRGPSDVYCALTTVFRPADLAL